MANVRGVSGYELKDIKMAVPTAVYTKISLDTAVFSPRGGAQSIKINENDTSSASAACEIRLPPDFSGNGVAVANEKWAFGFDFLVSGGGVDAQIISFWLKGGTALGLILYRDTASGKLHWYKANSLGTTDKGASIGSDGLAVTANTWYRAWIEFTLATGTGTLVAQLYVVDISGGADPLYLPLDCAGTVANISNTLWLPVFGGRTTAGLVNTVNYDNLVVCDKVSGDDQIHTVSQLVIVTGNGTDQDFTAVNIGGDTQHWQAVDEQPQNGNGTTDSDYVKINSATLKKETEVVTIPARIALYNQPEMLLHAIWHRRSSGKWGSTKAPRVYWAGVAVSYQNSTYQYPDPGTSYLCVQRFLMPFLTFDLRPSLSSIATLEMGIEESGDASAPVWVIDVIVGEMAYSRQVPELYRRRDWTPQTRVDL